MEEATQEKVVAKELKMRVVYIAHPLGDGAERPLNIARALKWVAWAADQSVAPVAPWTALASVWDESKREEGLAVDLEVIERCDELWACGPRISPGMNREVDHAKKHDIPVHILVDPAWTEGPPSVTASFTELLLKRPVEDRVRRKIAALAAHHGYSFEEFVKLSAFQVYALEYDNPFKPPTGVASEISLGGSGGTKLGEPGEPGVSLGGGVGGPGGAGGGSGT